MENLEKRRKELLATIIKSQNGIWFYHKWLTKKTATYLVLWPIDERPKCKEEPSSVFLQITMKMVIDEYHTTKYQITGEKIESGNNSTFRRTSILEMEQINVLNTAAIIYTMGQTFKFWDLC